MFRKVLLGQSGQNIHFLKKSCSWICSNPRFAYDEIITLSSFVDRTFKKLSSTKEINFLACAARIKKDCVVPSRKAFHFDENLQMCECGQLSRFDEVAVGTKVNSLSGMVMADTWSISKIGMLTLDPFW